MAPSRPIPAASPSAGARRGSVADLASSFVASLVDPSPLAHEVVARDLAELPPSESEADEQAVAAAFDSNRHNDRTDSESDSDSDSDTVGPGAPLMYRRPSAIAYGNSRPVLGVAPKDSPPLSRLEKKQAREAERSLLRDNHLLPPKRAAAAAAREGREGGRATASGVPVTDTTDDGRQSRSEDRGFFGRIYKRVFSTKLPRREADEERWLPVPSAATGDGPPQGPTEQTALLGPPALIPESAPMPTTPDALGVPSGRHLSEQWEAAVAAGQIHTTWQREAKTIAVYSRSLIITFLLQYSINITGVFAVSHIGKAELGAVSLAAMTASITFYAPCQGLATCLDTLCAQAYGSGHKTLVGLQLQRMCCFLLLLCVPLAAIWLSSEAILARLVPEQATAELAGQYLRVLVIGMPANAVFECSKRYMQAQGLFTANTYVLLVAAPLNILLNWLLVWHFRLGFVGAPISAVVTQWTMPLMLLAYVYFVDGSQCWGGFSRRIFSNWGPIVKLALPGMIMIEAEFFAFEILTLAAGRFGTTELAAQSILVTLTSTTYQIPFPMSIAASTRVANLIGARLPEAAKTCARVATVAGFLIGGFNLCLVGPLRYQIPLLFTNDAEVVEIVARTIPVCAFMQVFDGSAAVASGLLRGVGRQEIGSYANLAAYYIVALPISFGTAFGLNWQLSGLWCGVTVGLILVSLAEFAYLYQYDWNLAVSEAERRNASG